MASIDLHSMISKGKSVEEISPSNLTWSICFAARRNWLMIVNSPFDRSIDKEENRFSLALFRKSLLSKMFSYSPLVQPFRRCSRKEKQIWKDDEQIMSANVQFHFEVTDQLNQCVVLRWTEAMSSKRTNERKWSGEKFTDGQVMMRWWFMRERESKDNETWQ